MDRVEEMADGYLITDYKTGSIPRPERILKGKALQPLVYAEAISQEFSSPAAFTYLTLRRPDQVRRRGLVGEPAAFPEEGQILDATARKSILLDAADKLQGYLAGEFPPTQDSMTEAGCRRCPWNTTCRRS